MAITETVLEMHYHRPLMDIIQGTFGLGVTGKFNFYKYSPQREVFLGFDQAFAMTELSDDEFFRQMKASAMNSGYSLPSRFVAYFLQYKVVKELQKRNKKTPGQISSRPHYRSSLDTTKNDRTGFSQHELLFNLSHNEGAMVYYACPMVFDRSALYEVNVSLDPLRLVDMTSCPSEFSDNSHHHIYFDQQSSDPIWCSEPVTGKALSPRQLAEKLASKIGSASPAESAEQVTNLLVKIKSFISPAENVAGTGEAPANGLSLVAESLSIVRFDEAAKGS